MFASITVAEKQEWSNLSFYLHMKEAFSLQEESWINFLFLKFVNGCD